MNKDVGMSISLCFIGLHDFHWLLMLVEFEIEVLLERRKVSNKGKIIQANNIQLVELI